MDQNFYRKLFLVATILLFGVALLRILQPFGGALAWGACLALLLQPLHSWLTLRLRGRPDASAGIITALLPVVLLGPLTTLGVVFAGQIATGGGRG